MEELKSVLARFLLSGDSSAGRWLQAFTSSTASWELAFTLLREAASNIQQPSASSTASGSHLTIPNKAQEHAQCLFASQVIRSKVQSQLSGLDSSTQAALLPSLFPLLASFSPSPLHRPIARQLATAIACVCVQLPGTASQCPSLLLHTLSLPLDLAHPLSTGQLPEPSAVSASPLASFSSHLPFVLLLLHSLAEESSGDQRWQAAAVSMQRREAYSNEVLELSVFAASLMLLCSSLISSQPASSTAAAAASSPTSPLHSSPSSSASSLSQNLLLCLTAWIRCCFFPWLWSAGKWEQQGMPLLSVILSAMQDAATADAASEAITEIASQHKELVPYLLPCLLDQCVSLASQQHSASEQQGGTSAAAAAAGASSGLTSASTNEDTRARVETLAYPLAQALIDAVLADCSWAMLESGYADTVCAVLMRMECLDQRIPFSLLPLWSALCDLPPPPSTSQLPPLQLQAMLTSALASCCHHIKLPSHPQEQGQQQQQQPFLPTGGSEEEEEDSLLFAVEDEWCAVEEYRQQAEETLVDLSRAVGLEAYLGQVLGSPPSLLLSQLQPPLSSPALTCVEGQLFAVQVVIQSAEASQNTSPSTLPSLLSHLISMPLASLSDSLLHTSRQAGTALLTPHASLTVAAAYSLFHSYARCISELATVAVKEHLDIASLMYNVFAMMNACLSSPSSATSPPSFSSSASVSLIFRYQRTALLSLSHSVIALCDPTHLNLSLPTTLLPAGLAVHQSLHSHSLSLSPSLQEQLATAIACMLARIREREFASDLHSLLQPGLQLLSSYADSSPHSAPPLPSAVGALHQLCGYLEAARLSSDVPSLSHSMALLPSLVVPPLTHCLQRLLAAIADVSIGTDTTARSPPPPAIVVACLRLLHSLAQLAAMTPTNQPQQQQQPGDHPSSPPSLLLLSSSLSSLLNALEASHVWATSLAWKPEDSADVIAAALNAVASVSSAALSSKDSSLPFSPLLPALLCRTISSPSLSPYHHPHSLPASIQSHPQVVEALLLVGGQLLELKLRATAAMSEGNSGSSSSSSNNSNMESQPDVSLSLSLVIQLAAAAFPSPHRGVSAAAFQLLSVLAGTTASLPHHPHAPLLSSLVLHHGQAIISSVVAALTGLNAAARVQKCCSLFESVVITVNNCHSTTAAESPNILATASPVYDWIRNSMLTTSTTQRISEEEMDARARAWLGAISPLSPSPSSSTPHSPVSPSRRGTRSPALSPHGSGDGSERAFRKRLSWPNRVLKRLFREFADHHRRQ